MMKQIQSRMTSSGMVSGSLWKAVPGDSSYFYSQTLIGGLQSGLLVTSPLENQSAGPADYDININ